MNSSVAVLKYLGRFIWPKKWLVFAIVVLTISDTLLSSVAFPYAFKLLFDAMSQSSGDMIISHVWTYFYWVLAIGVAALLLSRPLEAIVIRFQVQVMAELEQYSFRYLLGHSLQFFQDSFSGSLVRRVTRLSRSFEDIADQVKQRFIPIIVSCFGVLIVLWLRSPMVGGIVLVWLVVMLTYNYLYARWKHGLDVRNATQDSVCAGFLADVISNAVTVKLFSAADRERLAFRTESNTLRDMRFQSWMTHFYNYTLQEAILIIVEFGVLWIGISFWHTGKVSLGDVVLFQSYFVILRKNVFDFSRMIRTMATAIGDAAEMVEILDMPQSVRDARGAKVLRVPKGAVVFSHVSFSYTHGRSVLDDFHVAIAPGEKVALVGPSGAGKSTVTKLLLRFHDLTQGVITIDGQNIATVTQDSLRAHIALVPQEPILFHRSLLENIRYARPRASEAEVERAARLAHCHEFIDRLPDRYHTYVGERGVKLSGGERQRVAMARAILKDAPVLILDEATSSLDSESERLIQDALRELLKDKTAIVIAHRLSTVMEMDKIVVMEEGRIIDVGTHSDLLARGGVYKKLWDIQVGGFIS